MTDPEGSRTDREGSRTDRARAPRPPEGAAIEVILGGAIVPADIPALWKNVVALLEGDDADVVVCDVDAVSDPDAATVDALARLQLHARRFSCHVWFRRVRGDLKDLLALMGLSEVLLLSAGLPLEPSGQTEEREPALGIEEEADPADPLA